MLDKLKIIRHNLAQFESLDSKTRLATIKDLKQFAEVEASAKAEPQSMCPVTKQSIRQECSLKSCKFWVDHGWTKNCALNFMLNQQKEKLSVEQVSLLYKKPPEKVDTIYKKSFKVVQRHYLKDHLRTKGIPQFTHIPGFCVECQTKLSEEDLSDQSLSLKDGHGYCSPECKKAHPPSHFEIEKFFESEFLRIVEEGSELFNLYYLEEILGFQPGVLKNRLEKLRDENKRKQPLGLDRT